MLVGFLERFRSLLGVVAQEARRARVPRLTEVVRFRMTEQDLLDFRALILVSGWIGFPISSAVRALIRAAVAESLGEDWRTVGIDRLDDGCMVVTGYQGMQPFQYIIRPDAADHFQPLRVEVDEVG